MDNAILLESLEGQLRRYLEIPVKSRDPFIVALLSDLIVSVKGE